MKANPLLLGAALSLTFAGLITWQGEAGADREQRRFSVDPDWPKPLPNRWLVGQVAGVAVDRHDRIWIIQRQSTLTVDERGSDPAPGNPVRSDSCNRAPAVMVFDREGHFIKGWGGAADPGFLTTRCTPAIGCEWPTNEHGIYVDHMDNVYIAGNGAGNHQVLKFTNDGSFVYQIGKAGVTGGSNDTNGGPGGGPCSGSRPTWKSTRRPTISTSPTATRTQARARRRRLNRRVQAPLGRLWQRSQRRQPRAL